MVNKKALFFPLISSCLLLAAIITIPANADDNNVEVHSVATNGDGFQYRKSHDNKDVIEGGDSRKCCIWNTNIPGCLWYCPPSADDTNVEIFPTTTNHAVQYDELRDDNNNIQKGN
ncbi:hypothetical protein PIB30_046490 [Stylosanthes scabra]|uniref:Secreted protein n=1 Tax=Stylosanthes scabra TaxID=79078 RepID=A0ABU6VIN7_9FABA|nr:hypothetical protein [Stylosanthes scabra]